MYEILKEALREVRHYKESIEFNYGTGTTDILDGILERGQKFITDKNWCLIRRKDLKLILNPPEDSEGWEYISAMKRLKILINN